MVTLSKTHKTSVQIEAHVIHIRIARLTFEQREAHNRAMAILSERTMRQRREIERAREESANEQETLLAAHAREDQESERMAREAIEAYVTVEPNQIAVDGREVLTGKDLLDCCSDPTLVLNLMFAIGAGSKVDPMLGKTFGSPSDSPRSSDASDASGPTAHGLGPEATAPSADSAATTANGAATAETDPPSSGLTGTSS